ncbi:hypothetical protein RJT34_04462 [Clitoria ternatea]|uniref:non-specific serine/threonine protein kinase n=1 Tax=Clitoria ternatea TaxID=43366 RepID=A0AAN9KLM4_CLITE
MEKKSTILMQRYEVGRLLGQGNFAKVYHARNLKTGQSVAIKVFNKESVMRVGLKEQIKREISVMRLVRHPNIVQLYEVMASKTRIYFAIELVKGGELFNKVARGKLSENMARKYFQQLIDAVDHCHSKGVYHRDLKPENLLLDENGDLKVSDFGLSALVESRNNNDGLLHTLCGTPAYVAPEVIKKKGYDGAKADIWSCGVILFVLLAGSLPFNDKNLMEIYRKISKAEFKFPQWFRSDVRKLLYRILDPNPSTRISIADIVQTNWFRKGYMQIESPLLPPLSPINGEGTLDVQAAFASSDSESDGGSISNYEEKNPMKLYRFNAFDLILLSSGLDISGLFEKDIRERQHARFTTRKPLSIVVSKLEEIASNDGRFNVLKENGVVRFEGNKTGMRDPFSIDAEIFEVASSILIVEVKKIAGSTLEFWQFLEQCLKPSLNEIVVAWQR